MIAARKGTETGLQSGSFTYLCYKRRFWDRPHEQVRPNRLLLYFYLIFIFSTRRLAQVDSRYTHWKFRQSAQYDREMRHPGALAGLAGLISLPILAAQTTPPVGTPTKGAPSLPAAVLVSKGDPEYTAEAKAAGLQGTVTLFVEVGLDGKPRVVHVLEGLGLGLDEKSVEVVKQWQYRPGQQGPAEHVLDIREEQVQFRLPDAAWRVSSAVYWYVAPPTTFREIAKPVLRNYHAPDAAACATSGATVVGFLIDRKGLP